MIQFLLLVAFLFMCYVSVCFRIMVTHPVSTIYYLITDAILYFVYHQKWVYAGGLLNCYMAHFGGGKTLSATQYVVRLYNRYNNRKIYDREQKKWVVQKVNVLSNVAITTIPYRELDNLKQIVEYAKAVKEIEKENNIRTVILVLIDEASKELNSREFKTNFNGDTLSALLTCRHVHMSIFYTAQKFKLVDALLRSVTQKCIWCNKIWRFMVQYTYDADELEYATNPTVVKEVWKGGFFIKDKHYNQYDTLATVEKLEKQIDSGQRLSAEEILTERGVIIPNNDNITKPSRILKKIRKHK